MPFLEIFAHMWYYQTALTMMYLFLGYAAGRVKSQTTVTAVYALMAYAAVAWHPLVDELLKQVR